MTDLNQTEPQNIVVISGGTASNSILSTFSSLSPHISYVLPISDNGGSTSEIIRVVGGPAIGDLRSRIVRLIPPQSAGLRDLLSHRLSDIREDAKQEWEEIVEGTHTLWLPVEPQCREFIRPFFLHIHVELLKRSRPNREFKFESASVGNLFLTGARIFCGSLDAAIELLSRLTLVPSSISVLPALNTNFSHNISAELVNGFIITGQSQISHPSSTGINQASSIASFFNNPIYLTPPTVNFSTHLSSEPTSSRPPSFTSSENSDEEDAHLPFSHPDLKTSQLHFSKDENTPLASPIRRIFYINPYGQEIHPRASTRVLRTLDKAHVLIYSIGSLFTSTVPVVILQGFANAIKSPAKKKIVLMNGSLDRETESLNGMGFIRALIGACLYSEQGSSSSSLPYDNNGSSASLASQNITQPTNQQGVFGIYGGGRSALYSQSLNDYSTTNSSTNLHKHSAHSHPIDPYSTESISNAVWSKYITHVVYLKNSSLTFSEANIVYLKSKGIKCVCIEQNSCASKSKQYYSPDDLQKVLSGLIYN